MSNGIIHMTCVGSGLLPDKEPCVLGYTGKNFHKLLPNKDTRPYNGIKNWRCPECFTEHRKKINL